MVPSRSTAPYVPTIAVEAVLLLALQAVGALAAGVDHAADADAVADGVLGHAGADLGDDAGDLVAGDQRVLLRAPVAADGVDVGVADAGELDLDQDVVRADVAAFDGGGDEVLGSGRRCVSVDGRHSSPICLCGWSGPWMKGIGLFFHLLNPSAGA